MLASQNGSAVTFWKKMATGLNRPATSWRIVEIIVFAAPIICIVDAFLAMQARLTSEAINLCATVVVQLILITLIRHRFKSSHGMPFTFIIMLASSILAIVQNGIVTGFYLYLLPFSFIYIIIANNYRTEIKRGTMLFVGICLVLFLVSAFTVPYPSKPLPVTLFLYRLGVNIILAALLVFAISNIFAFSRKRTDDGLSMYRALFNNQHCAIAVYNLRTGEITDCNSILARMFGIADEKQIKGMFLSQLMFRYLCANNRHEKILMDKIPDAWSGEAHFKTQHNQLFTALVSSTNFLVDQEPFQVLTLADCTRFANFEKDLNYYKETLENSIKTKARFLSSVSHELRTPLNGIIGTTNLVLEDPGVNEENKRLLRLQLTSSEHMLRIINDILDFSKIDSQKMEFNKTPFNLCQSLQNIVEAFGSQFAAKKLDLRFDYDPALETLRVNSDEVKLRQILDNLLSNALKFTFDGYVSLNARIDDIGDNKVTIAFAVKDTGIGIRQEDQRKIFEGFSQVHEHDLERRYGGTGLGLTISEKLANMFGSTINVVSEPGLGSEFSFNVRFNVQKIAQKPEKLVPISPLQVDVRGVHVLIVEDNEVNANILKNFLQRWGINIKEAANGIQALELFKYHKFDLILMDLEMPEMNGYTATEIIRQTNKEIPVIAFTATLLEDMESLISESGFTDYILKPFKPGDLRKKIERYTPYRSLQYA